MKINALFCPNCSEIVFSRELHENRECSCKRVSVDGGFDYFKFSSNGDYVILKLRGNKLLRQILHYDYKLGNRNVLDEYINGYHGKFKIVKSSNEQFYKELVKNWDEFKPYFDKIKNGDDR